MNLEALFGQHQKRILAVLPDADVYLSGSALVPMLRPQDVDLVVLVSDVVLVKLIQLLPATLFSG